MENDRLLIKILFVNDIAILLPLQQARSRDLPSYTSSSLPPLTDGDGGGRDSLTSATSTIIHEKCCSRMAWRANEKHFCGNKFILFAWYVFDQSQYLIINCVSTCVKMLPNQNILLTFVCKDFGHLVNLRNAKLNSHYCKTKKVWVFRWD